MYKNRGAGFPAPHVISSAVKGFAAGSPPFVYNKTITDEDNLLHS